MVVGLVLIIAFCPYPILYRDLDERGHIEETKIKITTTAFHLMDYYERKVLEEEERKRLEEEKKEIEKCIKKCEEEKKKNLGKKKMRETKIFREDPSCEAKCQPRTIEAKPVIYLYPKHVTSVDVKLKFD